MQKTLHLLFTILSDQALMIYSFFSMWKIDPFLIVVYLFKWSSGFMLQRQWSKLSEFNTSKYQLYFPVITQIKFQSYGSWIRIQIQGTKYQPKTTNKTFYFQKPNLNCWKREIIKISWSLKSLNGSSNFSIKIILRKEENNVTISGSGSASKLNRCLRLDISLDQGWTR